MTASAEDLGVYGSEPQLKATVGLARRAEHKLSRDKVTGASELG